jgi:hypothetical protein
MRLRGVRRKRPRPHEEASFIASLVSRFSYSSTRRTRRSDKIRSRQHGTAHANRLFSRALSLPQFNTTFKMGKGKLAPSRSPILRRPWELIVFFYNRHRQALCTSSSPPPQKSPGADGCRLHTLNGPLRTRIQQVRDLMYPKKRQMAPPSNDSPSTFAPPVSSPFKIRSALPKAQFLMSKLLATGFQSMARTRLQGIL